MKKIRKNSVPKFLYNTLGGHGALTFEPRIFRLADDWDKNYTGGTWEYFANEHCFFICPEENREWTANGCFETFKADRKTFGVAITLVILNQMIWTAHEKGMSQSQERLTKLYYGLKDWAFDDDNKVIDQSALYSIID